MSQCLSTQTKVMFLEFGDRFRNALCTFFYFKKKPIPIPDNIRTCVEAFDEFQCHLKYKHYSKQETFENFRERHANSKATKKCSVFWIFDVDQSMLTYIPLELYDSGEKKKNNKSVFLPTLKCIATSYRAGARPIKSIIKLSRSLKRKLLQKYP